MKKGLSFLQIENAIVLTKQLSATEKWFYVTLKSFRNRKSGRCFPSMTRAVERAGISKKTAYRCRTKLRELNLITWANERGRRHSCHYRFILEEGEKADIKRVLERLEKKKIGKNRTSLNGENRHHSNREKQNLAMGQNETTNKKNITRGKLTNKGSDPASLPSPSSIFTEDPLTTMPEWVMDKVLKSKSVRIPIDKEKEEKQRAKLLRQARELRDSKS